MRFMYLLLIFFNIFIFLINAQDDDDKTPKCTNDGDYCINHWDCCSKSCFSYLYKCVRSSQQGNFIPSVYISPTEDDPNSKKSTITLEQLILSLFAPTPEPALYLSEQNFLASRVGETNITSTPKTPECLEIGKKCYRDSECCSQRCHGFLHQCVT